MVNLKIGFQNCLSFVFILNCCHTSCPSSPFHHLPRAHYPPLPSLFHSFPTLLLTHSPPKTNCLHDLIYPHPCQEHSSPPPLTSLKIATVHSCLFGRGNSIECLYTQLSAKSVVETFVNFENFHHIRRSGKGGVRAPAL